jgi:hypothetical protein
MRHQTKFATIPLSGMVSETVDMSGGDLFSIWAPIVTSCAMFVQGSWDTTSANFVRLTNPAGSGDWTFAVGPGSRMISAQDVAFQSPYLRLETSVAQTAVASFAIPVKLR